jgi:hypothetical protein
MLRTVRLELARNPGFPEGSASHGYEIRVPLDEAGHIDLAQFKQHRQECRVRRFWNGERDLHGWLIHGRHGWAVSYAPGEDDDERIFRLDRHLFRLGEYVSITEPDGASHTFRVASLQ